MTEALAALERFSARGEHLSMVEKARGRIAERERQFAASPGEDAEQPHLAIARSLHLLVRDHEAAFRAVVSRVVELAQGLGWAVPARNAAVQTALALALFEHTAVLALLTRGLVQVRPDLDGLLDSDQVLDALARHRAALGHGDTDAARVGPGRGRDQKPRSARELVEALDDEAALGHYDRLRGLTRAPPAAPSRDRNGASGETSARSAGAGDIAASAVGHCLGTLTRLLAEAEKAFEQLDGYVGVASGAKPPQRPGASPFGERELAHDGDGSSKDTAVCFTEARDPAEAARMAHKLLRREKLIVTGRRTMGVESGQLYEVFNTNRGSIWFRTRVA